MKLISRHGLALAALLLAGCAGGPSPQSIVARLTGPCAPAVGFGDLAFSPDGRRILFTEYSPPNGNSRIFTINPDGTGITQLTTDPNADYSAEWSPDGARIVFTSTRGTHDDQIYVMNSDGTAQTPLTFPPDHGFTPAWSPDGKHIAFGAYHTNTGEIHLMKYDGSDQKTLIAAQGIYGDLAWSPDSQRIAYGRTLGGWVELHVVRVQDASDVLVATVEAVNANLEVAWSQDGQTMLYQNPDTGGIYAVGSDGTQQPDTISKGNDYLLGRLPDGEHILYQAMNGAGHWGWDIFSMKMDTTDRLRLTDGQGDSVRGVLSPDGKSMVFLTNRDGEWEIYTMQADGSDITRVTQNPANQKCIKWPF